MSTLSKFASQTAIYGATTIAARTLNFFLTPLFVGVYAAAQYGVLSELYSYAGLLAAGLSFGMETAFFRFTSKGIDTEKVYANCTLVLLITSAVFCFLLFAGSAHIVSFLQAGVNARLIDYKAFLFLFMGVLVIDNLCVLPFAWLRLEKKAVRYSLIKSASILVFVLLNLFFIFLLPKLAPSLEQNRITVPLHWIGYVFLANLMASTFTALLLLPEFLKMKISFSAPLQRELFLYSWPVLVANLSFIINENLDKIYLKNLLPPEHRLVELGIYSGCTKLAIFLNLFNQAFRLGAEPFFFSQSSSSGARDTYALIMKYFVVAVSLIFVAIVCNIELLKYFIPNRAYWAGLGVVPVILLGYVCLGIYMNLSVWYKLSDQTRFGFYISGIGALMTIVLNPLLIPIMGYMGSAWATLAAYFSMMCLSFVWGQKRYPVPYEAASALQILLVATGATSISFLAFHRNLLWGEIILSVYVLYLFLKERRGIRLLLARK